MFHIINMPIDFFFFALLKESILSDVTYSAVHGKWLEYKLLQLYLRHDLYGVKHIIYRTYRGHHYERYKHILYSCN